MLLGRHCINVSVYRNPVRVIALWVFKHQYRLPEEAVEFLGHINAEIFNITGHSSGNPT